MKIKGAKECSKTKKSASQNEADFWKMPPVRRERLLAILLDAGGAQSGQAMLVDGKLPGQEFVNGQGVAAAGFLEGEQAAANRGNDFGLAADHPPLGPGRGQIRDC
jgi:hypothetical protein